MTPDSAAAALAAARGRTIAVLGDVMLDAYVWGDVQRVSPDAPVPVVDLRRRSAAAGGAANVALNLAAAGAEVRLVGVVGDDVSGSALRALLREAGLDDAGLVTEKARRTTTKTRVVARGQQLIRLDEEDRGAMPAAAPEIADRLRAALDGADAVLVSDYAKGVVDAARMRSVAEIASGRIPVVVDPKARDLSVYRGCTAITPNRAEAEAASGHTIARDEDVSAAARAIAAACGASVVLITRGDRGLSLWERERVAHVPALAREVYDVTGAGDTVIAYFTLGLAAGMDAADAALLANAAGSVAVSKVGTTVVAPDEIVRALSAGTGAAGKILDRGQAQAFVERERSRGRRIVFTNGCFDLLHAGHVHLLDRARAEGDVLVVAVNSDASIRRLKGPERPLVSEADRTRVLAALDAVGAVVVFEEDTPLALIEALRPDVLVKGGDYAVSQIVGADWVTAHGGRVATIPLVAGRSTTALVEAIRRAEAEER
jgi:D-beta-D-heptose 7-phosphate kinase / D-beta-D-heptose 1-phosphate adenosyltransferase